MGQYYIIDPNAPVHCVWNHRLRSFAIDFDAYYGKEFSYSSHDYAVKRADRIMAENDMNEIAVVDRDSLFRRLDIQDDTRYS